MDSVLEWRFIMSDVILGRKNLHRTGLQFLLQYPLFEHTIEYLSEI